MADTNATRLAFVREVTEGVTPTTPAFQRFRYTAAPDVGQTPNYEESEEILDSGELTDTLLVSIDIGGSVDLEFSFESFDDLLEGAMRGTYQTKRALKDQPTHGLDITGPDTIAISTTLGLVAGDLVYLDGYNDPFNAGAFAVSVVTLDTDITVTNVDGTAATLITETAPTTATVHRLGYKLGDSAVSGSVVTNGRATLTFVGTLLNSDGLEPGDYTQITGWADGLTNGATNDGFYRILDVVSGTELLCDQLPEGYDADDGVGGDFLVYFGERLVNAKDRFSYTLQELFTDIGTDPNNLRQLANGMGVNQLTLNITAETRVTGSMSFVGSGAEYARTPIAGETFTESPNTSPLNTSSDIARIYEAGASLENVNCVTEMTVEINNNLEKKPCVGKVGGAGFRRGTYSVGGSMTTYFDNEDLVEKVINNEETSLNLAFQDPASHGYLLDVPRAKLTEGGPNIAGRNDDVTAPLSWQALRSPVFGYTTKLLRFWALG